jgi:hypothetical protein
MYVEYTNYIGSISSDINQWDFKSNEKYTSILEHVCQSLGDEYLREIITRFPLFYNEQKKFLIELCNTNDLYGMPNKFEYNDFTTCSPSNLRYILHSLLILSYMNECLLSKVDIIEIGGGYGGLCYFMKKIAPMFNITINSYTIFDLYDPLQLQKKYLDNLNINKNMQFYELNNFNNLQTNSFLISNYCFSEISMNLQNEYTSKVLNPYVSHGFLAWNFIGLYNFIDNKNITSENEYPQSGGNNFYIRIKPFA